MHIVVDIVDVCVIRESAVIAKSIAAAKSSSERIAAARIQRHHVTGRFSLSQVSPYCCNGV